MRVRIGKPKFGQGPASSLIETFSIGAAVDITFTPTGNISANNVQAAIVELDNEKVAKAGDTMTGFLTLSAAPTSNLHAATKQYVDDNVASGVATITYVDDENTAQDVITATKVAKTGDTMSGLLILSGNPTGNFHAATKEYVDNTASDYADTTALYVDSENAAQDAVIDTKVARAGDTLTGFLTLHADPTIDTHAATKKYVDDNIGSGSGTAVATIADAPPSSPVQGQLWFESDTGLMYIYYDDGTSTQWVPITTSAYIPTVTVDTPVLELTSGTSDLTPDFILTGDLILDDTVFFEYSTASDFTGAASLTNTIDAAEDAANEISFSTGTLAAGTWYFRAKVQRTGYVDSDWSNTEAITLVAGYQGPGDLATGWAAWYGLRAFSAATRGNPLMQLTRDAGGGTHTISSDAVTGLPDLTGVAAFISGTTGRINIWYDQTGNGHNIAAFAAHTEEYLPNATGSFPGINVNAGDAQLGTSIASNYPQPLSVSLVAKRTSVSSYACPMAVGPIQVLFDATAGSISIYLDGIATASGASEGSFHDIQGVINGSSSIICIDGTSTTGLSLGTDGVIIGQTIHLPASTLQSMAGVILEAGFASGAFSAPQQTSIAANQAAYYGYR